MNMTNAPIFSKNLTTRRLAVVFVFVFAVAGLLFITPHASLQRRGAKPAAKPPAKPAATAPAEPAQRGKSKRLFLHDKNHIRSSRENGRLVSNCDECHRIPGAFYVSENAQGFNVREFPDHPDCLRCHEHRKDFFRGNSPPICTVCHKGSTPRESDPGLFPKASGPDVEKDFTGRFPHGKHQDILALRNEPARGRNNFQIAKASFRAQDKPAVAERWDCGRCHQSYPAEVEKQLLANIDWPAVQKAFNVPLTADAQKVLILNNNIIYKDKNGDVDTSSPLLDRANNLPLGMKADDKDPTAPAGTFRQSPNGPTGHKYCFECHALTQGAWNSPYPRANDCAGCHGLSTAIEGRKPEGAGVAKTIAPLTLTAAGRAAVADSALLQKYNFLEVPRLMPRISYKFQHDIGAHQIECTACHVNITRLETISSVNPDVPMASCAACHMNKSSGGNIAIGEQSLNLEEEINRRRSNPQYVCIACHTPDTGKNPPPDSHYAVLGRTRF
jgi:hypothetical protein